MLNRVRLKKYARVLREHYRFTTWQRHFPVVIEDRVKVFNPTTVYPAIKMDPLPLAASIIRALSVYLCEYPFFPRSDLPIVCPEQQFRVH